MFQAEAVPSRHERPQRSSRLCDLSDALISSLAVAAAESKEGFDQQHLCARCLVYCRSRISERWDHLLTLCSETAFSIVRLVELTSLDISDVTWDYLPPIIWSTVESCVGMFCACLPVMAPLVPKFMRGRSGPEEPYDYSSFGPTNTARVTNGFAKQDFDRLEDDTAGLVLGRDHPLSIRQTTNIDIHEEGSIALHTMA